MASRLRNRNLDSRVVICFSHHRDDSCSRHNTTGRNNRRRRLAPSRNPVQAREGFLNCSTSVALDLVRIRGHVREWHSSFLVGVGKGLRKPCLSHQVGSSAVSRFEPFSFSFDHLPERGHLGRYAGRAQASQADSDFFAHTVERNNRGRTSDRLLSLTPGLLKGRFLSK